MPPVKSRTFVSAHVCSKVVLLLSFVLGAGCSTEKKDGPAGTPTQTSKSAGKANLIAKKPGPDELLSIAKQALTENDADTAIGALEALVAAEPKNREGLFLLSRVLQMKGQMAIQAGNSSAAIDPLLKSAQYIKQFRTTFPDLTQLEATELSFILFQEACALGRKGETDKAFAVLQDACNSGYSDLAALKGDQSLDKVRALPQFKAFLESVTGKMLAKTREHARELITAQRPFEFNFSLPDLDGKNVALKDFAGKILIADIWGTWCPPCRAEIPHFVELVKKYEGQGLRMVGINYENGSPDEAIKLIREFVKANGMNYPCLIGDAKTRDQIPNFEGFPTTLFIDRTGKVRLCVVGYHSETDIEAIVQELLDDKTTLLK